LGKRKRRNPVVHQSQGGSMTENRISERRRLSVSNMLREGCIRQKEARNDEMQALLAETYLSNIKEIAEATVSGTHCKHCGCEWSVGVCAVCGEIIVGCYNCHLDGHVLQEACRTRMGPRKEELPEE
jgi:hypothetical protein